MLFIVGAVFVKKKFPKLEPYQSFPNKKKNLILFLSALNENSPDPSQIKTFSDFDKIKIPWQMPVIAINYHLPVLENVFVVLSEKSKNNFEDFKDLVNRLFPDKNINIIPIGKEKDINFENFEDVNNILENVYNDLKEKYHAKDRDIILDVTSGQKIISIVGAMQTLLTPDREFQYVSTSDYQVKSFDVRYHEE
jgi:hypothetical protein